MNYFPTKKSMSLRDYLGVSYEPNWRLVETVDYIIYYDTFYSGLSILIDRDAYCKTKDDETKFFDMLRLNYTLPFSSAYTIVKYGNFFVDDHDSYFFLTEPKDAGDILIYDKTIRFSDLFEPDQENDAIEYSHEYAMVISTSTWFRYGIKNTDPSTRTLKEYAIAKNQPEFERALAHFYLN